MYPNYGTILATYSTRTVTSGQPIGVLFELIMGSKGGGFGMVPNFLWLSPRF